MLAPRTGPQPTGRRKAEIETKNQPRDFVFLSALPCCLCRSANERAVPSGRQIREDAAIGVYLFGF